MSARGNKFIISQSTLSLSHSRTLNLDAKHYNFITLDNDKSLFSRRNYNNIVLLWFYVPLSNTHIFFLFVSLLWYFIILRSLIFCAFGSNMANERQQPMIPFSWDWETSHTDLNEFIEIFLWFQFRRQIRLMEKERWWWWMIYERYTSEKMKRKLIFKVFIHTLSLLIIKEYIDLH